MRLPGSDTPPKFARRINAGGWNPLGCTPRLGLRSWIFNDNSVWNILHTNSLSAFSCDFFIAFWLCFNTDHTDWIYRDRRRSSNGGCTGVWVLERQEGDAIFWSHEQIYYILRERLEASTPVSHRGVWCYEHKHKHGRESHLHCCCCCCNCRNRMLHSSWYYVVWSRRPTKGYSSKDFILSQPYRVNGGSPSMERIKIH